MIPVFAGPDFAKLYHVDVWRWYCTECCHAAISLDIFAPLLLDLDLGASLYHAARKSALIRARVPSKFWLHFGTCQSWETCPPYLLQPAQRSIYLLDHVACQEVLISDVRVCRRRQA